MVDLSYEMNPGEKLQLVSRMYAYADTVKAKSKGGKWGLSEGYTPPPGAMRHTNLSTKRMYWMYNIVWMVPDTNKIMISKFILDSPRDNSLYSSDLLFIKSLKSELLSNRLNSILNDLSRGKFVFDDNDKLQDSCYKDESKGIYYQWDTCTHYLEKFQNLDIDELPYSKSLDGKYRLTYAVKRPVLEHGEWVSHIRLSRCNDHFYDKYRYSYDEANNKFGYVHRLLHAESDETGPNLEIMW